MVRNVFIALVIITIFDALPLSGVQQRKIFGHETVKENGSKRLRIYTMSKSELDKFLWVESNLLQWLINNDIDTALAKARAEIATARSFGIEPPNWAKRDIGTYVEMERIFEKKKEVVEKRLKAAQDRAHKVESNIIEHSNNETFNPLKMAAMYWFQSTRDQYPHDPYAIAIDSVRKVEYERDQLYKQFHKETPEEKAGNAFALLQGMMVIGDVAEGSEIAPEAEAALGELGEAGDALAVSESEAAMNSIIKARAILVGSEEDEAALIAVERARTALDSGDIEKASKEVENAKVVLSTQPKFGPVAALVLNITDKALTKLDSLEEADIEIGVKNKAKIGLYEYASRNIGKVKQFLANDLTAAIKLSSQYQTLVAEGKIVPAKESNKVLGRESTNEAEPYQINKSESSANTIAKQEDLNQNRHISTKLARKLLTPILENVAFDNETSLIFHIYDSSSRLVIVIGPYQHKKIFLPPGIYYNNGGGKTKTFTVIEGKPLLLNFFGRGPY